MNTSQRLFRNFLVLCCMQLLPALAWAQSESGIETKPVVKMNGFYPEKDETYKRKLTFENGDWGNTPDQPYLIQSAEDLMTLVYLVNYEGETFKGKYFKLGNDIVLNPNVLTAEGKYNEHREDNIAVQTWYPIGRYGSLIDDYFAGIFDGDGHTISGLILDRAYDLNDNIDELHYVGLFGKIKNATIKNLTLRDCYIRNWPTKIHYNFRVLDNYYQATHYGALVGYAAGTCTIENCHIEQSLYETNSNLRLGGLVGYLESGSITNCSFDAVVDDHLGLGYTDWQAYRGGLNFGGIVGQVSSGLVANCHAKGKMSFNSRYLGLGHYTMNMGGICGYNDGMIKGCSSDIQFLLYKNPAGWMSYDYQTTDCGEFKVGGVAGVNRGTIKECVAKGNFSLGRPHDDSTNEYYESSIIYISGIANLAKGAIVEDCANFTNLGVDETFNPYSRCAGIGVLVEWEGDKKAEIRRCISVCDPMDWGILDREGYKYTKNTNQFEYAGIAPKEEDNLIIDNCYSFNTKANKTLLDANASGVTHYATRKDMAAKNPFNSTGVWGTWPADGSDNALCPLPIAVGGEVTGLRGEGTIEVPYRIGNAAELNKMADLVNDDTSDKHYDEAYYELDADIFMGSTPLRPIGTYKKPFRGTFNGKGHYISNLTTQSGCMFQTLYGTVKNLSLVDYKQTNKSGIGFYGIVERLGSANSSDGGVISNCYLNTEVHLYRYGTTDNEYLIAGGLCYRLNPSGTIENSYVVGDFTFEARTIYGEEPTSGALGKPTTTVNWGGLVWLAEGGTLRNCYVEAKLHKVGTIDKFQVGGVAYNFYKDTSKETATPTTVENCRFVCPEVSNVAYFNQSETDISKAGSVESSDKLNDYFNETTGGNTPYLSRSSATTKGYDEVYLSNPWKKGYYRPVLLSTKTYKATTPEGDEAYIDAIPTTPKQPNYFLKVNLTADDFNSDFLQKFQGVAFYSPTQKSDYLLNWNIDPEADWQYVPTEGATVKGRASLTLHRSESNNGNGWFMLCLPGELYLSDLPTGSKVYVLGAVNETTNVANMVKVKTIPAGMPFLLYLPEKVSKTITDSNGQTTTQEVTVEDVTLVVEGEFATTTQRAAENSALLGTGDFKGKTIVNLCNSIEETTTDETTTRTARFTASAKVNPFAAYINHIDNVELADYLLLDEGDPRVNDLIVSNDGKNVRVKLLRKFKAGQWNTICLPFRVGPSKIHSLFGNGTVVNYYNGYNNHQDGTMTIYFEKVPLISYGDLDVNGSLTAGIPFLIKPEKVSDNDIYDFGQVTISTDINGDYAYYHKEKGFKGTFAPIDLRSTTENFTYFLQGDHIYFIPLSEVVTMRGFRAYFQYPTSMFASTTEGAQAFIIEYGDGTTTRITPEPLAPSTQMPAAVYDLQGRRLARPGAKGVYIIGNQKIIK